MVSAAAGVKQPFQVPQDNALETVVLTMLLWICFADIVMKRALGALGAVGGVLFVLLYYVHDLNMRQKGEKARAGIAAEFSALSKRVVARAQLENAIADNHEEVLQQLTLRDRALARHLSVTCRPRLRKGRSARKRGEGSGGPYLKGPLHCIAQIKRT